MRVCFIMVGLPHYIAALFDRMARDYHIEVILIKPGQTSHAIGSGVKEENKSTYFKVIELDEYITWYGKAFLKDLLPTLKQVKPDIVVMSAWPYFLQFALNPNFYFKFRKLGIRLICRDIPFNISYWGKSWSYYFSGQNVTEDMNLEKKTFRGYLNFLFVTLLRRIYLPLADAHINYFEEARAITGSYGVPSEKIFITSNSPDTDALLSAYKEVLRQPQILAPNPHRIIHVGRLVKWKKVDMIIRSVKNLQSSLPSIELVVVGYGPELEPLKKLAQDEGVADRVVFVGGVYDPVILGRYLHASSAYVLGGMGGLSINDAMCFAKPVICSVADGTEKSLVREGYNGYYFDNTSQASLDQTLSRLLSDEDKIREFGQNSLSIIENEINIHTVLQGYENAFKYVLKKPKVSTISE